MAALAYSVEFYNTAGVPLSRAGPAKVNPPQKADPAGGLLQVVGYFRNSSRANPTIGGFRNRPRSRQAGHRTGECHIQTHILRARMAESGLVGAAAIAIPILLVAPAIWNGYPLLQWDTGGYLA